MSFQCFFPVKNQSYAWSLKIGYLLWSGQLSLLTAACYAFRRSYKNGFKLRGFSTFFFVKTCAYFARYIDFFVSFEFTRWSVSILSKMNNYGLEELLKIFQITKKWWLPVFFLISRKLFLRFFSICDVCMNSRKKKFKISFQCISNISKFTFGSMFKSKNEKAKQ